MKTVTRTKCLSVLSVALCGAGLCWSLTAAEPQAESAPSASLPPAHGMSDSVEPPKTELKPGDKAFLEKAAKAGQEDLAISRVAVERATNPQVREFAQMMVSAHSGSNTELMSLAASKGVILSAKDTNVEKWESRKAKSFDQEYMERMVSQHQDAVGLYEKQAKKGSDADLMNFAGKTLPTLQAHLAKAQALKKILK